MVTTEPSKITYYWKNIWEIHKITAKWLQDLRTSYSNLPVQEPPTITSYRELKNIKNWIAPNPDMIHTY